MLFIPIVLHLLLSGFAPYFQLVSFYQEKGLTKSGNGLRANYFSGMDFDRLVHTRTDEQIDFLWTRQDRPPGANDMFFSVRWTGKLLAPATGDYLFVIRTDEGARLWIDGKLLIDKCRQWRPKSALRKEVYLEAGQYYDVKIEYYNFTGPGVMQLLWESPETEITSYMGLKRMRQRTAVPQKYLYSTPVQIKNVPPASSKETPVSSPVVAAHKPANRSNTNPQGKATTQPQAAPSKRSLPPKTVLGNAKEKKPVAEFSLEKPEIGKTLVLNHVFFEQSKYILLPGSYNQLDSLVQMLHQYPTLSIEIAGHTDNVGDPQLNQALSEQRAQVVANYLISQGITASRITTRGYGGTRPVGDNSQETGRARNRRVEFTIRN